MAKENDKNSKYDAPVEQEAPYSNMAARRIVLLIGLSLTAVGFVFVLFGALNLFAFPNMFGAPNPHDVMIAMFATGLAADFVGIVFAVAGGNTAKPLARLAFFLGLLSFIVGAGMLTVAFILKLIPTPAFERLTGVAAYLASL